MKMNTEQEIKSIKANLDRLYSELDVVKGMVLKLAQLPDGMIGNSSDSPYVKSDNPDPYAVDWTNAPDWADVHAFDGDGSGYWYGACIMVCDWIGESKLSPFRLPDGLDWKLSKTYRPQ